MELSAVILARVIFFVESVDLNPRGAAFYPAVIRSLIERYKFVGYPQKLEDFDEQKGVTLTMGRLGDKTIDKIVIYNWGITLDTTSSTADSEELLDEALVWGANTLHLSYTPDMVKRKTYVSQITFYSQVPLLSLHPILETVCGKIDRSVSQGLKFEYHLKPRAISFGVDPAEQRIVIAPFSIERREGTAFSENKYFSTAPVHTDAHIAILNDLERAMDTHQTRMIPFGGPIVS